jgi:hypothetical protein
MTTTAIPADGVDGVLIWVQGLDRFMFRVYNPDHTFKEYDINHSDLCVTIKDQDAYFFYEHDTGLLTLDHSPETLGKTP